MASLNLDLLEEASVANENESHLNKVRRSLNFGPTVKTIIEERDQYILETEQSCLPEAHDSIGEGSGRRSSHPLMRSFSLKTKRIFPAAQKIKQVNRAHIPIN